MGSASDWPTMQAAVAVLERFDVAHEAKVISAHRMPDETFAYAEAAAGRGLRAIIAGAGGAAALPGVLAAKTTVPVLGVPVPSGHLNGQDAMLSMVQMPPGIPVATFAIGAAGATNAALFAVALLAATDTRLAEALLRVSGRAPGGAGVFDVATLRAPSLTSRNPLAVRPVRAKAGFRRGASVRIGPCSRQRRRDGEVERHAGASRCSRGARPPP